MNSRHSITAHIATLERLTPQVMRLFLQPHRAFAYQPGQYLDILHEGEARSFSLACAPRNDGLLELHIRRIPGNPFMDHVFEELAAGDTLSISGPFGAFALQPPSGRRRLFVAGGTGFAPIKSFLETLLVPAAQAPAPSLYWGARTLEDLYLHETVLDWQRKHGLHYVPVLSHAGEEPDRPCRSGLVHEAVLADVADFGDCEVYVSGPPPMVTAAREAFLRRGLDAAHFHTETY